MINLTQQIVKIPSVNPKLENNPELNKEPEVQNVLEKVLTEALNKMDTSRSLFFFNSKINKSFSDEKKLLLIETLWEIILADGEVHDFESNLIRRLAGLLYISDVSCGNAKNKALQKINQEGLKS